MLMRVLDGLGLSFLLRKTSKYINVSWTTAESELVKLQLKRVSDMKSRVQQETEEKPGTNFPCEKKKCLSLGKHVFKIPHLIK